MANLLGSTLNRWAPAAPAPPVTRFVKVSNPNSKLEDSTSKSCWEVGNFISPLASVLLNL